MTCHHVSPDYTGLPWALRTGVQEYVEHHHPPGDFLTAVISNDLKEALGRADDGNRARLFDIVAWFYNEAPGICWGSPERMRDWLALAEVTA